MSTVKLSHEEGEALMEEGRAIEEYLQAIEPPDGEAGERGRQA